MCVCVSQLHSYFWRPNFMGYSILYSVYFMDPDCYLGWVGEEQQQEDSSQKVDSEEAEGSQTQGCETSKGT